MPGLGQPTTFPMKNLKHKSSAQNSLQKKTFRNSKNNSKKLVNGTEKFWQH